MRNKLLYSLCFTFSVSLSSISYETVYSSVKSNINLSQEASFVNPGVNFRVFPDTVTQVETSISVHPFNSQIIAGAAVTDIYPGGYTTGIFISTNGGNNWQCKNAIKDSTGLIITTVGNPKIVIDKNGTMILSYIAPNPLGGNNFKVGVSYSTNNGLYWSKTVYIPGVDTADKSFITTDCIQSSPYFGRSYIVYNERRGIYFSYSTNGGKVWSAAKRVSPPTYYQRTGASIAVSNGGEVYITWPYTVETNKYIGFAKSTNGGIKWDSSDTKIPVTPVNSDFRINLNLVKLNGLPVITADNSGGERNGWLYIVSSERAGNNNPATDSCDIIIRCSSNHGATWPLKFRVNQDIGTYKHQFFPAVNVDNTGRIEVVYYDDRNTPTRDSFQVYVSSSENGGQSFEDILVSDHKFKLKQMVPSKYLFGIPSYIGTGIGIASSDNKVLPFWYDNSENDEYQVWCSVLEFRSPSYIKAVQEGFYNPVFHNINSCDTLKAYLRYSASPYIIADSACGIIDSLTFTGEFNFNNAVNGNYYIDLKHRNSIEVWSSAPVPYSVSAGFIYDFTVSSSNAYGNNLAFKSDIWCLYSCDVNQDGISDIEDISIVENDAANSVSGYINSDLTGDGIVDSSDMMYAENNTTNSVSSVIP